MPYRDRLTTWKRALADAEELAGQPAAAFAGKIPTVRRVVERLHTALVELEASGRVADRDVQEMLALMQRTLPVLRDKLLVAERAPDIVVNVSSPPEGSARRGTPTPEAEAEVQRLLALPRDPPPRVVWVPTPEEAALDRARGTPRGFQLRVIEICMNISPVNAAVTALVSAMWEDEALLPQQLSLEHTERALRIVEKALGSARKLLAEATTNPAPSDPATDAALAEDWADIVVQIERAEAAVAAARSRLDRVV